MQFGKKRTTIADIAKASGDSKTAVSFAFNCPSRISEGARERILEIARKLDYIPDPSARNFSLGKQLTLGFLLPQGIETSLENPYLVEVIRGLGTVCQDHGYMLTVIPPLNDSIYEAVKNATVDGLVTMGYLMSDGVDRLVDLRAIPLVMIDGEESGGFLSVNIDDEEASYVQLENVIKAGHRKIAVITLSAPDLAAGDSDSGLVGRRLKGYRKACQKYGLNESDMLFCKGEATFSSGQKAAEEIMLSDATCIVAMSDIQAYGAINALEKAGKKVPEDISVVGFDGIQLNYSGITLSTIDQPAYEKGRIAAITMFDILDGRSVEKAPRVSFSFRQGDTLTQRR